MLPLLLLFYLLLVYTCTYICLGSMYDVFEDMCTLQHASGSQRITFLNWFSPFTRYYVYELFRQTTFTCEAIWLATYHCHHGSSKLLYLPVLLSLSWLSNIPFLREKKIFKKFLAWKNEWHVRRKSAQYDLSIIYYMYTYNSPPLIWTISSVYAQLK